MRAFLTTLTVAAAAALVAGAASAQPRGGTTPQPVVGPTPAFRTGAADWVCGEGRCRYALNPHAADFGWSQCVASWYPTHGGWRKQNVCR